MISPLHLSLDRAIPYFGTIGPLFLPLTVSQGLQDLRNHGRSSVHNILYICTQEESFIVPFSNFLQ